MRARPPTMEVIAGVSFRAKVVIQDMGTTINFTPIRATNQYHQNQGHQNSVYRGYLGTHQSGGPTFDGRLDPWVFTNWLHDMDHFYQWYNLSDNRRVRFAKMKLTSSAQLFWSVEELLIKRNEPPIIDWVEMKLKLEEKHLSQSYGCNILDQWNNLR